MTTPAQVLVIGVAGGSGGGKTTLCRRLARKLGDEVVWISSDCYYHCQSHLPRQARESVNYDHPDALDFELLRTHLDSLRNGDDVDVPRYCFESHTRVGFKSTSPRSVILVEGTLLFVDDMICRGLDLRIFLDAASDTRLQRRLARDCSERGRTEESVRKQWRDTVSAMHDRFVAPTRRLAHIVLQTDLTTDGGIEVILHSIESLRGQVK